MSDTERKYLNLGGCVMEDAAKCIMDNMRAMKTTNEDKTIPVILKKDFENIVGNIEIPQSDDSSDILEIKESDMNIERGCRGVIEQIITPYSNGRTDDVLGIIFNKPALTGVILNMKISEVLIDADLKNLPLGARYETFG